MKAFWWFREGEIAGMARPGFNSFRWFDLEFDEAVLMSWLGTHPSGSASLESFRHHLQTYAPRIFRFYELDNSSGASAIAIFESREGVGEVLARLKEKTKSVAHYAVEEQRVHFELCRTRLDWEIEFMKNNGIGSVVTLTERHHSSEVLQDHFDVHHIAIQDLGAPQVEQVAQLAEVVDEARQKATPLAVHCLAGIGRTSTMLIGAHILLGEKTEDLLNLVKRQNPAFVFTGEQADFIRALDSKVRS